MNCRVKTRERYWHRQRTAQGLFYQPVSACPSASVWLKLCWPPAAAAAAAIICTHRKVWTTRHIQQWTKTLICPSHNSFAPYEVAHQSTPSIRCCSVSHTSPIKCEIKDAAKVAGSTASRRREPQCEPPPTKLELLYLSRNT